MSLQSRLARLEEIAATLPVPRAGSDQAEGLDAVLGRYVRDREAGGPEFERVPTLEWIATSAGYHDAATMEHEQEWEAAMRAGFPRQWRHVRRPDGRWSYEWA